MRTGCLVALAWLALASWAAAARANAVFETPFFSVTVSPESGGYEVLSRRQAGEQSGRRVLPLFEVEYRDCIAMYGKYGYDLGDTSEYVLHHLSMGRPLHYHNLPPHLYWTTPSSDRQPSAGARDLYTHADLGWAEGMHRWDRFIKNTAEILSPLHELTARTTVSAHEFLTPDYKVQRTIFGDGFKRVEVIVNGSSAPFTLPGANAAGGVVLPAYGFLVTSPTFLAFCALETSETRFSAPTLFTSRTVDDRPFRSGSQVRVFHGFGDRRFTWAGKTFEIAREGEITLP